MHGYGVHGKKHQQMLRHQESLSSRVREEMHESVAQLRGRVDQLQELLKLQQETMRAQQELLLQKHKEMHQALMQLAAGVQQAGLLPQQGRGHHEEQLQPAGRQGFSRAQQLPEAPLPPEEHMRPMLASTRNARGTGQ
jgi:hypothetical protein